MSEDEPQTEGMKALEQSLNDHMEICRLQRKAKRLKAEVANLKTEVERLIKAGDNLITALDKRDDVFDNSDKRQAIADWNVAKDASQA